MRTHRSILAIGLALLGLGAVLGPAAGQTSSGKVTTAAPTYTNLSSSPLSLDTSGNLRVTTSGTGSITVATCAAATGNFCHAEDDLAGTGDVGAASLGVVTDGTTSLAGALDYSWIGVDAAANTRVVGNVASGAADAGNPVKIGGVYLSTLPTVTSTNRNNLQLDVNGKLHVQPSTVSVAGADGVSNTLLVLGGSTGATSTAIASSERAMQFKFNGSTWDRDFTCPSSAVINVTAAATTQLVALQSSQIIRVCSFVITESLAGTAKFVYGTGSNCGTGTTDITGAMALATNASIALSSSNGSLFRTIASNALCLTAVTGNITGFLTYAQY